MPEDTITDDIGRVGRLKGAPEDSAVSIENGYAGWRRGAGRGERRGCALDLNAATHDFPSGFCIV